MESLSKVLGNYINQRIPRFATNIFFQILNGVGALFDILQYRLDVFKKESNMLTAESLASLRSLTAQNGFEPALKVPSKGVLLIQITPALFGRVGFPIFLPPYSIFVNKISKFQYYYANNRTIRIDRQKTFVEVIEGQLKTQNFTAEGEYISRFYIQEQDVAEDSITLSCEGKVFQQVNSFFDTENVNENRLFEVKFSNDSQNPIVIYVKNLEKNQIVSVTYRLTYGELGNLDSVFDFETDNLLDGQGVQIVPNDDEILIQNVSGFTLGSNGTDENSLRSAIGYNHGIQLLFDNISYTNFISKYSTILLQSIEIAQKKSINNLYLSKKVSIVDNNNVLDYVKQYKNIIENKLYLFTREEFRLISKVLTEYEYTLSSHNLFHANTNNYAIQVMFKTQDELELHKDKIQKLLYQQFTIFFYNKYHVLNLEDFFTKYKADYEDLEIDYILFDAIDEQMKYEGKTEIPEKYIIQHTDRLPLLNGNFYICSETYEKIQLFFDINFVSNENNTL
jgi:hypothetical protein